MRNKLIIWSVGIIVAVSLTIGAFEAGHHATRIATGAKGVTTCISKIYQGGVTKPLPKGLLLGSSYIGSTPEDAIALLGEPPIKATCTMPFLDVEGDPVGAPVLGQSLLYHADDKVAGEHVLIELCSIQNIIVAERVELINTSSKMQSRREFGKTDFELLRRLMSNKPNKKPLYRNRKGNPI
jgi:hypothetical protein